MTTTIEAPKHRLSKHMINVWLIKETIDTIIIYLVLGVLFYLDYRYDWYEWVGWVLIAITAIGVFLTIIYYIRPFLLYANWRYGIDEEFIQLKMGAWREVHQLIPMTKVQSVSTVQGPLLRKYGLYALSIKTMGSSHQIPALPKDVAFELRNQIAQYAKIDEVDEA